MDKSLEAAYRATHFVVEDPRWSGVILVGEPTSELDDFLRNQGLSAWAYITAYNPRSEALPDKINRARHKELLTRLEEEGVFWLRGEGRDPKGEWPPEVSVLACGLSREQAVDLGDEFGQNAIVVGKVMGKAELVDVALEKW